MSVKPALQIILKKKSIMDYLEKKGIHPAKSISGGRYTFYCPLPDHNDKKSPSFIVWTNSEYENFHCFGCQRGYSIIHLLAFMEGLTIGESIRRLSEGLDVSIEENISYTLEGVNKMLLSNEGSPYVAQFDLPQKMMSISSLCRMYLKSVEFDSNECGIMDQFWAAVDDEIHRFDFTGVDETLSNLPEILRSRREKFEHLKVENERKQYASR